MEIFLLFFFCCCFNAALKNTSISFTTLASIMGAGKCAMPQNMAFRRFTGDRPSYRLRKGHLEVGINVLTQGDSDNHGWALGFRSKGICTGGWKTSMNKSFFMLNDMATYSKTSLGLYPLIMWYFPINVIFSFIKIPQCLMNWNKTHRGCFSRIKAFPYSQVNRWA